MLVGFELWGKKLWINFRWLRVVCNIRFSATVKLLDSYARGYHWLAECLREVSGTYICTAEMISISQEFQCATRGTTEWLKFVNCMEYFSLLQIRVYPMWACPLGGCVSLILLDISKSILFAPLYLQHTHTHTHTLSAIMKMECPTLFRCYLLRVASGLVKS